MDIAKLDWLDNTCCHKWYRKAFETAENIEHVISQYIQYRKSSNLIHKSASIHPTAVVGENVVIEKDAVIGPHCYVRGDTVLCKGSHLGYSVEVIKSVIGSNTKIIHISSISNSVLGNDVNIGAGFIVSTRRLDNETIRVRLPTGQVRSSARSHMGTIVGHGVHTGTYVTTMPGATIGRSSVIYPRSTVTGAVPDRYTGYMRPSWAVR